MDDANRAEVDDRAAGPLLDHPPPRRLRAEEAAGHVYVKNSAPLVQFEFLRPGVARDKGVVDEHVHAPEAFVHSSERGLDGLRPGDVALDCQTTRRPGLDFARCSPAGGDVDVEAGDPGARTRERERDLAADAGGRAGDDRDAVVEPKDPRRRPSSRLGATGVEREVASVNGQQSPGHHRRGVGDEEQHRADHLPRLAEPVERDAREELLANPGPSSGLSSR